MTSVRPYLPLLGFVVPTVVVGYGFVIPRSCIAGVNELTIGFGTTIIGAALTYVAGQRAVLPKSTRTKPPLGVRITRAINRQAARPSGWFGRVLGFLWPLEHARLNAEVLDALDIRAGDRVLEIGTGSGHALREAARRAAGGRVVGVDVSELMVELAQRVNREAIARGSVRVMTADADALALQPQSLDRVFSVNCVYFWRDVDAVLAKLASSLASGGKLVLAFRPDGDEVPARFRDPAYRFPRVEDVESALTRGGMYIVRCSPSSTTGIVIVLATKR